MSNKKEQLKKSKTQLVKQLSKQKRRVLALSLSAPVIAVGLGAGTYFTIKGCSKTNPETPPGPTPPPGPTTSGTVLLSTSVKEQDITLLSKSVKKGQDSSFELNLPDQKALKNIVLTIGKTTIGIDVLEIDGGKITVPAEYMTTNKIIVSEVELEDAGATGIVLNITSKSLKVGESFEVSATLSFDASTITWSTSGTGSVTLSSEETESGQSVLVTATSAGDVILTATCGEYYAICNITIGSTVKSFSAKLLKSQFGVGTAIYPANLQVSVTMSDGTIQDNIPWVGPSSSETGYDIQYSNSGVWTSIANFGTNGYTFTEIGSCQFKIVFSKDSTWYHNVKVTVLPSAVERIDLNPTSLILELSTGESKQITPTVYPTVYDPSVYWEILGGGTNIATVDQEGNVTPTGLGECTVGCTSNLTPSVMATCSVKVVDHIVPVTGVTLDSEEIYLDIGDEQTLVATVEPEEATNKNVTWSVKHPDIASVDENGKVKAIAEGSTTVIVTTEDGSYQAQCQVYVTDPSKVQWVSINKSTLYLEPGKSETLTATVYPETAPQEVDWSSSDSSIASVDENGKVTAGSTEGTAYITATSRDDPTKYDTCMVYVQNLFEAVDVTGRSDCCYIKAKQRAFQKTEITIPEKFAGKTVIGIADNGFVESYSYIQTISFETPDNIEYIGASALSGNTQLTTFEVPAKVTTLNSLTFNGCTSLSSITFGTGTQLENIEANFIKGCTSLTSFTVPASTKEIKASAFADSSVTSVEFASKTKWRQPANISIDVSVAGDNATNLKNTSSSATNNWGYTGITTSDPICFEADSISTEDQTCLAKINTLGTKVTDTLTVPEYITKGNADYKVIGVSSIGSSSQAKKVAFAKPENITTISDEAFYWNEALQEIEIPGGVKTIGRDTFNSCTSLVNLTLNEGLETISPTTLGSGEHGAFYRCTALKEVTIPNSVTSIGEEAFGRAGDSTDGLTVKFASQSNSQLKTISDYAFYSNQGPTNLVSIDIPDNIETIGKLAFTNNLNLKTVNISPNCQLTTIGSMAFWQNTSLGTPSLQSLYIPSKVTSIGSGFVQNCTALSSLTFAKLYGWRFPGYTTWFDVTDPSTNASTFKSGSYSNYALENVTPTSIDVTASSHHIQSTVDSTLAMKATYGGMDVTSSCTWSIQSTTTAGIIEINSTTGVITVKQHGQTSAVIKCEYTTPENEPLTNTYDVEVADFDYLKLTFDESAKNRGSVYINSASIEEEIDIAIPSRWWYDYGSTTYLCTVDEIRNFATSKLKGITLPSTITKIDNNTFASCTNLKSIVIPASVTYIGQKVFNNCAGYLTSATFLDTTSEWYSDTGYGTRVYISSDPAVNAANLTDCSSSTGWGYTGLYKKTS